MRILPTSKQEWLHMLWLPFKTYAVIFPIWCLIYASESFRVREAQMPFMGYTWLVFMLCVPVFTLAALIQVLANQRQAAIVSLVFALAIPLSAYFLLSLTSLSK
jgi:ABC-type polysaccharide transport system permease subunit